MTRKTKKSLLFAGFVILLLSDILYLLVPKSSESQFRSLFADLSVGIPEYQKFYFFEQPADAIKGDHFSLELGQSESQFRHFASKLGLPAASTTNRWVNVGSKIDPKYPWMLEVQAAVASPPDIGYRIHIEGRQPYD